MNIWTENNTVEEALNLREGTYCADFGFLVQQSVDSYHVILAAQAIIDNKISCTVASQAEIIVKAKQAGVAFKDWAELKIV